MARWTGFLLAAVVAAGISVEASGFEHRVWLLTGIPSPEELTALRAAGVDGLVVPVGTVRVERTVARFTVAALPELSLLAGWNVSALIWAEGSGRDDGGAADFVSQLAPVTRLLPGSGSVILATRDFWEGLPRFAASAARRMDRSVEVAASVSSLVEGAPASGWRELEVNAVAFGLPQALGFRESTYHDDERNLDRLTGRGTSFRVAVVTGYRVDPPPASRELPLEQLIQREVATFRPGSRGNVFSLRRSLEWGGVQFAAGQDLAIEGLETLRYHRSMAGILRRVRPGLVGWDTVGLPAPHPTIGMSREAFSEYLRGAVPVVRPEVRWERTATNLKLTVRNPSPFSTAFASTGNYLEVRFSGAEIRDARLGRFSGVEYGRFEGGRWRPTVAREANAIRFFFTWLGPEAEISGAEVQFMSRPRDIHLRWAVRDPDGAERSGSLESVDLSR